MDIIGTMYAPTGATTQDEEGNVIPILAAIDGYHVNTPESVESFTVKQITPNSPSRIYAGHPTFFYVFSDETEFKAMATEAGLINMSETQVEKGI